MLSVAGVAALLAAGAAIAPTAERTTGRGAPNGPPASMDATPRERVGPPAFDPQSWDDYNAPYDGKYHFVRVRYDPAGRGGRFGGFGRGREPVWAHDYPRGERNFLSILKEVTYVDLLQDGSNILTLDDPGIFRYPILYIVEVGFWDPTDEEVAALGEYLLKGGFLIVDDTRDERGHEYASFAHHMERALPGLALRPLEPDHEIFDSFFGIDPRTVIPPYGPRNPEWYGIFEDDDPNGRLMVVFNFNNDLSEYWEFSERGYYPIDLSNEAYKLGVNYIVYAVTH